MVEILLDHGAHVNVMDNDGDTPLHIALAKESFLRTDFMSEMVNMQCRRFLFHNEPKRDKFHSVVYISKLHDSHFHLVFLHRLIVGPTFFRP